MLEEMVKAIMKKVIGIDYPHLTSPAIIFARVEAVHRYGNWYDYRLIALDRFGNQDKTYPLLPRVRSKKYFIEGTRIAVALPYGELTPVILEEVDI